MAAGRPRPSLSTARRIPAGAVGSPRDRRIAEIAVLGVMVLWAANFIVVKSAVASLPPVGFTLLRFSLAAIMLLVLLRWREGSIRLPRRDLARDLRARGARVRDLPDPVDDRAADDRRRRLRADHRLDAGPHRRSSRRRRVRLLTPAEARRRPRVVRGRRARHRQRPGLSSAARSSATAITLIAAICWAFYTAFGAPFLRRYSPLRTTAWATVARHARPRPDRRQPAVDRRGRRPDARRPRRGALLGLPRGRDLERHREQRDQVVGPTRTSAYQFLVPALAVVLAFVFLSEPIRPGQVVGGLIIVTGVLITRGGAPFRVVRSAART